MSLEDPRRRLQLRLWAGLVLAAGTGTLAAPGHSRAQAASSTSRTLVAYYSRTGHTRVAARIVAEAAGAELFEIVTATPYPAGYQETVDLNASQRAAGVYPAVARLIPSLERYDTVFLGYPIWAVDLPRLLVPFLERQDFAGKRIAPFCTSAMSGLAGTPQTLQRLCPGARVLPGLSLPGGPRGHNTEVTRIDADSRQQSERWARQTLASGERR